MFHWFVHTPLIERLFNKAITMYWVGFVVLALLAEAIDLDRLEETFFLESLLISMGVMLILTLLWIGQGITRLVVRA